MCETECLYIFLQARRDVPLIAPETLAFNLRLHSCEQPLYLDESLASLSRDRAEVSMLARLDTLSDETMQEEYDFLGEVRDVAAGLESCRRVRTADLT